jgi:hypothetical protein
MQDNMPHTSRNQAAEADSAEPQWRTLCQIGGAAALLQLVTTLVIVVVSLALGREPTTAEEYFNLLQTDRLAGLLRSDFTSLIVIALYLGTFPGIYGALRRDHGVYAGLTTALIFVAVASTFATHSGFSMLHLSDQYAAASSEAQRSQLLTAGEAIMAADMWRSTGGFMTGILLQGAGVLISAVMLRSKGFSRVTAYAGIIANGFDLAQHLLTPFAPGVSAVLLMIAGPFYLAWFPLLARDLYRLGRGSLLKESGRSGACAR